MDSDSLGTRIVLALITLLLLAGLVYGVYYCITYRKTISVEVQARQWEYWKAIKWDTHETRLVSSVSCSGTGSNRKCTTSWHTETYTVSHTRCSNSRFGAELPPVAPDLSCQAAAGDYVQEGVTYRVTFLEDGQPAPFIRTFDGALWDRMRPGTRRNLEVDIIGSVMGFAKE